MVNRNENHIWLIPFLVFLNSACSWVPYKYSIDVFLFWDNLDDKGNSIGIPVQLLIYVLAYHAVFLILWFRNWKLNESVASPLYRDWFFVEVLSLLDVFLFYEHPFYYLDLGITYFGIEFTHIKVLLYIFLMIKWKTGWTLFKW